MVKANSNLYKATNYENIRDAILDGVDKYSDCVAFTLKSKVNNDIKYTNITYKEFGNQISELGNGLLSIGLKDKKIALIGPNSYEWVLSYVSILFGVGSVVPLDKGLPNNEIEDSIVRGDADAIIFDEKYIDVVNQIRMNDKSKIKKYICMHETEGDFYSIPKIMEIGKKELYKGNDVLLNTDIDADKASIILFTSGTTSLSKAVMLSQRNIAENINAMNACEKLYNTDVNLVMLPFHHTFGSTGILLMLNNGVKNVFCDGLRYIQDNMKEYKVSVFVCVPLILEAIHKRIMAEVKKQGKEKALKKGKFLCNVLSKIGIDYRRKVFSELHDKLGGNMRFVVSRSCCH